MRSLTLAGGALLLASALHFARPGAAPAAGNGGSLTRIGRDGRPAEPCPLKHTGVHARISGFLSRVTVTQEFESPFPEAIEAVYTFPLPEHSAVDDMMMLVGGRTVRGVIKRREEARAIYDAARNRGQAAALLDQERPNIFTQSVANIRPGDKVKITISYVETLRYEGGSYEFVFPMVVGPRYIPANLPDAGRITPPVTPPGTRAGHDISVEVAVDAGVAVANLQTPSHDTVVSRPNAHEALVRLKNRSEIPNRDFRLRYDVAGPKLQDALLAHSGARGGFFTLILQPPERVLPQEITPKEIVFVLDTSGSMSGFPIEKAKEAMRLAIAGLHPDDTFNLITFAGETHVLFPAPVRATPENLHQAEQFLLSRRGGGGTEMMKAIRAALAPSESQSHVRVVCFMTDGYVGNDMEILGEIQRYPNARVFSFGIGDSVNRLLLDNMARYGRGEVEYVALNSDGSAAARRFHERVRTPLLTDISIDWGGLPVADVYPSRIPDLFAARPLIVHGRFTSAARGVIRLAGKQAGRPYRREIAVELPASEARHDVLAALWARTRVADLMSRDWMGMQRGAPPAELREAIVKLGLEFRLMTQFTSFVAVEERIVTEGGQPRRIEVPVELPGGVSYEGVFGRETPKMAAAGGAVGRRMPAAPMAALPQTMNELSRDAAGSKRMLVSPAVHRAEEQESGFSKMHPAVAALAASGSGQVRVKVWLKAAGPAVTAKLAAAGLKITNGKTGEKFVTGLIEVSKLRALAAAGEVTYIEPDKP